MQIQQANQRAQGAEKVLAQAEAQFEFRLQQVQAELQNKIEELSEYEARTEIKLREQRDFLSQERF